MRRNIGLYVENDYHVPAGYIRSSIPKNTFEILYDQDKSRFRGAAFLPKKAHVDQLLANTKRSESKLPSEVLLTVVKMLYCMHFGKTCIIPVWGPITVIWAFGMFLYFERCFFMLDSNSVPTRNEPSHQVFLLLKAYCFDEPDLDRRLALEMVGVVDEEGKDSQAKIFWSQFKKVSSLGEGIEKGVFEARSRMLDVARAYSIAASYARDLAADLDYVNDPELAGLERPLMSLVVGRPSGEDARLHRVDYVSWLLSPDFPFSNAEEEIELPCINGINPLELINSRLLPHEQYVSPDLYLTTADNSNPCVSFKLNDFVAVIEAKVPLKIFSSLSSLGFAEQMKLPGRPINDAECPLRIGYGTPTPGNTNASVGFVQRNLDKLKATKTSMISMAKAVFVNHPYSPPTKVIPVYDHQPNPKQFMPASVRHLELQQKTPERAHHMESGAYLLRVYYKIISCTEIKRLTVQPEHLAKFRRLIDEAHNLYLRGVFCGGFYEYCEGIPQASGLLTDAEYKLCFQHKLRDHLIISKSRENTTQFERIVIRSEIDDGDWVLPPPMQFEEVAPAFTPKRVLAPGVISGLECKVVGLRSQLIRPPTIERLGITYNFLTQEGY